MADEHDYAALGRPEFGGPLNISQASRAVQEAAEQGKRTAAKAEQLIDLLIEMVQSFRATWGWLLFRK